jgi:hypothetical protein
MAITLQGWTQTPNRGTITVMRVDQPEHSDLDHGFGSGAHDVVSHEGAVSDAAFGLGHQGVADAALHGADQLSNVAHTDVTHPDVTHPDLGAGSVTTGLHFDPAHGHVEIAHGLDTAHSLDHDFTAHESHDGLAGLHDSIHHVGLGFDGGEHHGLDALAHHDPAADQHHGGLGDFLHH